MKILITGTNGFIGKNLLEHFQDKIHNLYFPKREQLNLLDSLAVFEYLKQNHFDIVINCCVNIHSVEENLKMYFNLERCSQFYGKMFCIGSGSEYDMKNYTPRMKEEYFSKYIPDDTYGFAKYVIAKNIEEIPRNIYNLRVFGIYGKYEDYTRRFISDNICRVLCNLNISINRNMYFDYIFEKDFCKVVEIFIDQDPNYRSYNICAEKSISLMELAEMIRNIDGGNAKIIVKNEGLNPEYSGDNSRFINEFGPFHYIKHEDAINELYQWYNDPKNFDLNALEFN